MYSVFFFLLRMKFTLLQGQNKSFNSRILQEEILKTLQTCQSLCCRYIYGNFDIEIGSVRWDDVSSVLWAKYKTLTDNKKKTLFLEHNTASGTRLDWSNFVEWLNFIISKSNFHF